VKNRVGSFKDMAPSGLRFWTERRLGKISDCRRMRAHWTNINQPQLMRRLQFFDELRTDLAGCSGDDDAHSSQPPVCLGSRLWFLARAQSTAPVERIFEQL